MALAGQRRSSTATPRGGREAPKKILGDAGTPHPVSDKEFVNGATEPVNVQKNLDDIVENEPRLDAFPRRRSVVDSSYVPLSHIIVNAEGDKWPVNYYKQHNGLNDEMMPLAKGTAAPHQQYIKINDFIIHVTSPLTQQQDQETKEFTVNGEGTVYFGLIPNKGDMFVADVGDGRAGMFTVTETERLSYSKEACYRISYVMVDFLTPAIESQAEDKVVRTYYFELALVELHESPYLTEDDYLTYINLNEQESFITDYFNRKFWSRVAGTIAVPAQRELTHDAYHAYFCGNVGLGSTRNPIQYYTNGYTRISEIYSIWDVFRDMDASQLSYVHPTFGITSARNFYEVTIARGITWSQFKYTVYPTSDFFTPDDWEAIRCTTTPIKDGSTGTTDESMYSNGANMLDQGIIDKYRFKLPRDITDGDSSGDGNTDGGDGDGSDDTNKPTGDNIFPTLGEDQHYVFTKAFYEQDDRNASKFERVALAMLRGEPILSKDVAQFCSLIRKIGLVEQFYYIPILLLMIKYSKRGSL